MNLRGFEPSIFSAAGAVVSAPGDLNRFYSALLTGRLLRPDLVRQMTRPRSAEPLGYGLGVYSLPDPCPAADGSEQIIYGHDGASFGTLTVAFSSADGRRQAALSVTGRLYDPEAVPPPIGEFAVAALLATCPQTPPAADSAQRQSHPSLTLPDLDRTLTAATLWAAPTARNTLQSMVSQLRRALGDAGVPRATAAGYALVVPPGAVDAIRVVQVAAASAAARTAGYPSASLQLAREGLELLGARCCWTPATGWARTAPVWRRCG